MRTLALIVLLSLVAGPALAQQPQPTGGGTPPSGGCGAQGQPACQAGGNGGCPECPPPCPGQSSQPQQQPGENADAPSLEFAAPAQSGRNLGGGQTALVAGLANDAAIQATNALRSSFTGSFDLYPRGATLNATHFDITLAPGEKKLFPVRVTPGADQQGLNLQARLAGTVGGIDVCAQSNINAQIVSAVSMEWVTPRPNRAMATLEQLSLRSGGGGGGDLALGAEHEIKILATNFANVTSRSTFVFARVNEQTLPAVQVPALAAGATLLLDLGAIPPPPPDCNGPVSKVGCGGGIFINIGTSPKAESTSGPPAVSFAVGSDGVVGPVSYLSLSVADPGDVFPIVEGSPTTPLGRLYTATLNATNFGGATRSNQAIDVTFVPPFRAQYDVQGAQTSNFLLTTAPGATSARAISFTPMISGRWEMLVSFIPTGEVCCSVNSFTVDVPGPVNVSVPSSSVAVVHIGETARTPILVRAGAPLSGATLRITTAPLGSQSDRGPRAAGPAVLGGLSQTLVSATPTSVPLGDLAAGVDVWSNVSVTARASGVYNVVPYVVAGGFAYTGAPLTPAEQRSTTPPAFTPQFTVAFAATSIPLALAWAPAAFVLLAGGALFVGRRVWIK